MTAPRVKPVLLLLFFTGLLAACSGGTGGTGATGATGVAYGSISRFGSITVNEVKFDTSNAQIIVEGQVVGTGNAFLGALGAPDPGRVVRVLGSINGITGVATRVIYNDSVEGPLDVLTDKGGGTLELRVMGQTVYADSRTRVVDSSANPVPLSALVPEQRLEVSGLLNAQGQLQATFIEIKEASFDPAGPVEVRGVVSALDKNLMVFQINALTVNYAGIAPSELPPAFGNNMLVEVKGAYEKATGILTATRIEAEDDLDRDEAEKAETEGFVTDIGGLPGGFQVGSQAVAVDAGTLFKGGLPADIVLGARVEVEGRLLNGVLLADEVEFNDGIEIESDAYSVVDNGDTHRVTFYGLAPVTVIVNDLTEITGDASTRGDLAPDQHMRVRGRLEGASTVIASRVEVSAKDPEVELQGPAVEDGDPGNDLFSILDVEVSTVSFGDDQFSGVNDTMMGRDAFYAAIQPGGVLVGAKGVYNTDTGGVDWDEVEIEEDD